MLFENIILQPIMGLLKEKGAFHYKKGTIPYKKALKKNVGVHMPPLFPGFCVPT